MSSSGSGRVLQGSGARRFGCSLQPSRPRTDLVGDGTRLRTPALRSRMHRGLRMPSATPLASTPKEHHPPRSAALTAARAPKARNGARRPASSGFHSSTETALQGAPRVEARVEQPIRVQPESQQPESCSHRLPRLDASSDTVQRR